MNSASNWVIAAATVFAAIASFAAARAAISAYRLEKNIEKHRRSHLKMESVVKFLQELMVAVGEIRAIAEDEHMQDKQMKVQSHASDLRRLITIIGSLNPQTGHELESWYSEKDTNGNSISQIIHYELAQIGGFPGEKYNSFFKEKSKDLRIIQDSLFSEMSA